MLDISLIMLSAGDSSRFNLPVKKQFLRLNDLPLWLYATKNISSFYPFKQVIVTSSNISYMKKFAPEYNFVKGGKTRAQSLLNALNLIQSEYVLVSDVARVLISNNLFNNLMKNYDKADCISPVLKVADTTIYQQNIIEREKIKLIQTPQLSKTTMLKKALEKNVNFTDDSTAIQAIGGKIWYIQGDEMAKKITYKEDLKSLNLPKPSQDIFSGNGFDVHEFGEQRPLILGGIEIHPNMGLKAHSDGDVLAHSLIDALLGAAGLGDIGELFPDTDKQYKNANSMHLLQQSYDLIQNYGFELVNTDITIIAQTPKMKDFKDKIIFNIAKFLKITPNKINVKATTTEHLGFVGRKEGIAVLTSVNLKYYDWTKQ